VTPEAVVSRLQAVVAAEGPALDSEITPGMITVTVPVQAWLPALACARDELGCDFFDWLTGVDLATATGVYRGAAWHERETHEMFGVVFDGHPGLDPLLLPDGFDGVPLRKDFVLAARREKDWPGAKEPGEQDGTRGRRRIPAPAIHDGWPAS
jgi:NADH-quinone oxidoreductase subunit C